MITLNKKRKKSSYKVLSSGANSLILRSYMQLRSPLGNYHELAIRAACGFWTKKGAIPKDGPRRRAEVLLQLGVDRGQVYPESGQDRAERALRIHQLLLHVLGQFANVGLADCLVLLQRRFPDTLR